MRLVTHTDPAAVLPPRIAQQTDEPRTPPPFTAERLRNLSTELFRFQGEIDRQKARMTPTWAAAAHRMTEEFHGLVLAVLTLSEADS